MTGYDRAAVVGHNCKFLQTAKTEPAQVVKIGTFPLLSLQPFQNNYLNGFLTVIAGEALSAAKPIKIALTNARKDGSTFMNLLAMKPVFDLDGTYSYVIGVQFDVSSPQSSSKDLQAVEDLLRLLPNILI